MIGSTPALFRRHVPKRSHDQAGSRQARVYGGKAGHAEVEELHVAIGQHEDVAWLDIPVNDALAVRIFDALTHLDHQ